MLERKKSMLEELTSSNGYIPTLEDLELVSSFPRSEIPSSYQLELDDLLLLITIIEEMEEKLKVVKSGIKALLPYDYLV